MGLKDFLQNKTADQVRREKVQAIEIERLEFFKSHWTEEERLLGILRPAGEKLDHLKNPFLTWITLRGPQLSEDSMMTRESAPEWYDCFPESLSRFGPPLLPDGSINHDMLASALGESPFSLRYSTREELYYFCDYSRELAYRPTTEGRIESAYRAMIWKASVTAQQSSVKPLLALRNESRRVIAQAKVLLAVEASFFMGAEGERRFIDGRYMEPEIIPTYSQFVEETIIPRRGEALTVTEAREAFGRYCSVKSVPPVRSKILTEGLKREIEGKFGITQRHDIHKAGKVAKGWSGIGLQPDF
jgi:hypothetical protein